MFENIDWSSLVESLGLIGLAALCGGIVGLERELKDKPAGLRTHMLVAAAAATFIITGDSLLDGFAARHAEGAIDADPLRIMQAIVVGIGFLGAGTIVRRGDRDVEGLTTAASILLVSAIGVAVASGLAMLGLLLSLAAVIVISVVGMIERHTKRHRRGRTSGDQPRPPV